MNLPFSLTLSSGLRGLLLALPLLPLTMFFPGWTAVLLVLAFLSSFARPRWLRWLLGAGPVPALGAMLAAQIVAGLLCLHLLMVVVLLVAAGVGIAALIMSRGLIGLGAMVAVAGVLLGRLEWPFYLVGPLVGAALGWAWSRRWTQQLGRWLPWTSLLTLTLLVANITWYAGTQENAADRIAATSGVEKIFGYEAGKRLGGFVANRARYLAPLPDGSLALGVRGGEQALLRLTGEGVEPLGAGRYATDNAVVLADGLLTGDIRRGTLYRIGGRPWQVTGQGDARPDKIGILRLLDDTLYTISANRPVVQAFAATTFARGRTYEIGHLCSDMAAADGLLYLATFVGGRVLCLDPTTGRIVWEVKTGNLLQQNLALSEHAIYVTGFLPGRVAKLDRRTGRTLAVRRVDAGYRFCAFDAANDALLVADYLAGAIRVLAADDLRERAAVPIGRRPRWLEPDGAGALLVTSAAGGFRLQVEKMGR